MKAIYLAHPVGAPTHDGIAANLESARRWLKLLIDGCPDVAWCVSWLPYLDVIDDSGANRERGLRDDCEMVRRCDAIALVGVRVSVGMRTEADAAAANGRPAIDVTGMDPSDAIRVINLWVEVSP